MRKIYAAVMAFAMLFCLIPTMKVNASGEALREIDTKHEYVQSASEPVISIDQFKEFQNEGIIGEDVSYETFLFAVNESNEAYEMLDRSDRFHQIYNYSVQSLSAGQLKAGDILITNAVNSLGIIGHAAIVIGYDLIMDIPGPGNMIRTMSSENFKSCFQKGWIKIYRPVFWDEGNAAAVWARNNYLNKKPVYKITMNINSTTETYCSKIVFQAYKFGVGRKAFNEYPQFNGSTVDMVCDYDNNFMIIAPYHLPISLCVNNVGEL